MMAEHDQFADGGYCALAGIIDNSRAAKVRVLVLLLLDAGSCATVDIACNASESDINDLAFQTAAAAAAAGGNAVGNSSRHPRKQLLFAEQCDVMRGAISLSSFPACWIECMRCRDGEWWQAERLMLPSSDVIRKHSIVTSAATTRDRISISSTAS